MLSLFCSLSGYLSLNYSALTSLAHHRYRRGAEIKVPRTLRRPSLPSFCHSTLSHSLFQVFDCNFLASKIEVFCLFFPLRFGSASCDLDLSPLSGKLSTRKDPHCYFKLGSLSAVDLLSALSSPPHPAFMFSVLL